MKRGYEEESEYKRRRTNLPLRPAEFLDIPARALIMKALIKPMIEASQNQHILVRFVASFHKQSQSYTILFDSIFSLLTISDENHCTRWFIC